MATKKRKKGPAVVDETQCGVRCFWRDSPRHKLVHSMTCTLPLGHEKDVHEEFQDGKWMGGWVDRQAMPEDNIQQFPREHRTPHAKPDGGSDA